MSQVPVPANDGGKLSVWGITKSLYSLGYKIFTVAYLQDKDYDESLRLMREFSTPYILKVRTNYTFWGALKSLFSTVPYNSLKFQRHELKVTIRKILTENKIDIVQIEHLHMGWIVDEIRKLSDVPVILREQNLEMNIMKRFYENQKNVFLKTFAKLQYKKFIRFEPKICAKFDQVVMISKFDENALKMLNSSINVTTISAGINKNLFQYEKKEIIPFSLVHIGHTDWYPNLDGLNWFLNDVLPDLVKKEPRIKLYIYGGGKTHLFQVSDKLKSNIEVVGFVDDLWENLADKSLAIVPLRIGGGIRIKILELLAVGIPILSTNVGKEGINVEDKKHLLIANTKEEIIRKILKYFNNEYDVNQMSRNGKTFIREYYTWDKISKEFDELYKLIL